jgi:hypothetical protein
VSKRKRWVGAACGRGPTTPRAALMRTAHAPHRTGNLQKFLEQLLADADSEGEERGDIFSKYAARLPNLERLGQDDAAVAR